MKHLFFIALFMPLFLSFSVHGVFTNAVAHKTDDKTIVVFGNRKTDTTKKTLNMLNEKHYQAFNLLLKQLNRHTDAAVIVDISTDNQLENLQSSLSYRLYKNFNFLRKTYNNITFSTQELRTPTIFLPMHFIISFSQQIKRNHYDISKSRLTANENRKMKSFLKLSMQNMQKTTIKEYQNELDIIQNIIKEKYPDHYEEYLPLKSSALRFFSHHSKQSNEQLKEVLYKVFNEKPLSYFTREVMGWICEFDYYIADLYIKNSLKNHTVTILCSDPINAFTIQEILMMNYNNPTLSIGESLYANQASNNDNSFDASNIVQLPTALHIPTCSMQQVKLFMEKLFVPFTCHNCHRQEELAEKFQVCSNCKKMHYCSKTCQKSDWQNHKKNCAKKPALVLTCQTCQKTTANKDFQTCSGCKSVNYCSKKCQKIDWKRNHKTECSHL